MMNAIKLDRQDLLILEELQRDSRIPRMELADKVNLSPSQCFRRLKRLDESGIIESYTIRLDQQKAGYDVEAMVMVQFNKAEAGSRDKLLELIEKTEIINECYSITGEYDFLLKVSCRSMKAFNGLINETFMKPFISDMHSYMLLDCFKNTPPLPQLSD